MRSTIFVLVVVLGVVVGTIIGVVPATAQTETTTTTNTTVTNTTIIISIENITAFKFGGVIINLMPVNSTQIDVVYYCYYNASVSECCPIEVDVLNGSTVVATHQFTNETFSCNEIGVCVDKWPVHANFTTFVDEQVIFEIYNITETKELIARVVVKAPPPPSFPTSLAYVATLMVFGLLIGLAMHGSIKSVGAGLIVFGVVMFILPYIGIYIDNIYVVGSIALLLGIILLFASS